MLKQTAEKLATWGASAIALYFPLSFNLWYIVYEEGSKLEISNESLLYFNYLKLVMFYRLRNKHNNYGNCVGFKPNKRKIHYVLEGKTVKIISNDFVTDS